MPSYRIIFMVSPTCYFCLNICERENHARMNIWCIYGYSWGLPPQNPSCPKKHSILLLRSTKPSHGDASWLQTPASCQHSLGALSYLSLTYSPFSQNSKRNKLAKEHPGEDSKPLLGKKDYLIFSDLEQIPIYATS